jgi:hypothetical protein
VFALGCSDALLSIHVRLLTSSAGVSTNLKP